MGTREHWEHIYRTRPAHRVGWFKPRLDTSLAWIEALGLPRNASIIDVGSGTSTLALDLLDAGYGDVTVLDVAQSALDRLGDTLGDWRDRVRWIRADVTEADLPDAAYDVWHDRAVFHFLTDVEGRHRYRDRLSTSIKPGGYLVIGTFAPEAPPTCSGLPVCRYDRESLAQSLGDDFEWCKDQKERHMTPGGVEQMYLYSEFRRR